MTSTTETQLSPSIETYADALTPLVDGAALVLRQSTRNYVAGLNAIVEQQKFAYEASQQWVSAVVNAQSELRRQLAENYGSATDEVVTTARRVTKLAEEEHTEGAESGHGVARATRKPSKAVPKATRRSATTTSNSASSTRGQSGPAKWTDDAYDALTAVEVIEQVSQLSQRELGEVEAYEKAHQSRQTVLAKIASLRGQEPLSGYDELNVQEIHKQISDGDNELAARVRDYERPRKNRDGVLAAAAAKLSNS